ncbi:MAG: HAMP domain-containing histidine kinase [Ignavibacteriaceae bacterium]|nr:HAMP domain-containing histidine kinase [Ignavibacteriaceae bacterium]
MILKTKIHMLLTFLLLIPLQRPSAAQYEEAKNILFLFSLNQGIVAYQMTLENFKNTLRDEYGKPYNLYVEYLDVGKIPYISYQEYLFEHINEKYKSANIDLLICVGPRIMPLLEKYAATHIINLPTISLDLRNPFNESQKYSLHSDTKEILLSINAKKNFELAFSLFPDFTSVYIISGVSDADAYCSKIIKSAVPEFEKLKNIINLTDLSMEEVLNKVTLIPQKSIIIMASFLSDANHITYNTAEAVRLIRSRTSAPIFILFDTAFNEGALGGFVGSFTNGGLVAGKAATKILNGENPNHVQIDESKSNQYMFNYQELERFNLVNSSLIPDESIILFEKTNLISRYKWILAAGISFIILQALLIITLVRKNKNQKLLTHQLIETENRYRELVREDRLQRMSELTASLSHELNQPLTAIRNSAQAGLKFMYSENTDPKIMNEIFQNIVEDNKRAADVLSSIRELMKLEKREKQKIDLNLMIKQVKEIFRGETNQKNLKLQLNLPEKPVYVLGDNIQIQQVLLNFISNAEHAIEEGSSNNMIEMNVMIVNDIAITSVRDYGKGIDESVKNKLFRPFVTTREKGFGIGLAISKSIIDEHGGKIWAENNPDGGATFSFQLKLWNDDQRK